MGVMERLVLNDTQWVRIAPLIIGRSDQKGLTGRDNLVFYEGVLWVVRTGSPWRDLPEAFGDWNSVWRRFSRWSSKGVWWRIFEAMADDPDFEYLIIDSTIVRAHQHAAGAKKGVYRSGHWPITRRAEYQDPYRGPRSRLPCSVHAHRGSERRRTASRCLDRGLGC